MVNCKGFWSRELWHILNYYEYFWLQPEASAVTVLTLPLVMCHHVTSSSIYFNVVVSYMSQSAMIGELRDSYIAIILII
jgi:hypothetical protein